MLTTIDYIIVVVYFIIVLVAGWLSGRKETKEGYLIADRKLGFLENAATIFSSKIGAGILLVYTALVYLYGLDALWYFIGAVAGYFTFYFFAKKIKKLSNERQYYTLPDFFFDHKGKLAGYLISFVVFLSMLGWVVVNFTGGAKIITAYSTISFELAVVLMGVIILIYLLMGGFKAVVKTDVIQTFGILLLFILMIFLLIAFGNSLNVSDFKFFTIPFGQIINFFLAGLLFPFASAELWQRVYASKDENTLKKTLILASILYIVIGIVLLFIGLVIRSKLSGLTPDSSLVMGLSSLLPAGLAGLAVVMFFSAIMSSADTYLFTSNASLTQDLLQKSKLIKKEKLMNIVKVTMSILMVLAIILSIIIKDVVDTTFIFVSLMMPLGLLTLLIWIYPKLNKYSVNLSISLSLIGTIILTITKGISTSLVTYSLGLSLIGLIIGSILNFFIRRKVPPNSPF